MLQFTDSACPLNPLAVVLVHDLSASMCLDVSTSVVSYGTGGPEKILAPRSQRVGCSVANPIRF